MRKNSIYITVNNVNFWQKTLPKHDLVYSNVIRNNIIFVPTNPLTSKPRARLHNLKNVNVNCLLDVLYSVVYRKCFSKTYECLSYVTGSCGGIT